MAQDAQCHGPVAVAVMARAPSTNGKSRLAPHVSTDRLLALKVALLSDALTAARNSGFDVRVFVAPDAAVDEVRAAAPGTVCVPQRGSDLGSRMDAAVNELLDALYSRVIVIGTDVPQLTPEDLRSAARLAVPGVVVLGPAADGGYYLVAIAQPVPALFTNVEWGTQRVRAQTIRRARGAGLDVTMIRQLRDLDTVADLQTIEMELTEAPPGVAPAVRRWIADGHGAG